MTAVTALATVIAVGIATVQDGGRHGFADVGVPTAGALHRERYLLATAALRGAPDPACPAIEVLDGGLALQVHDEVVACLVGPAAWQVGGHDAAVGATVRVPAGAVADVRLRGPGPAYLVLSGWGHERVLGSASTDTFSWLGGAALAPGTVLAGDPAAVSGAVEGVFHRDLPEPTGPVRILAAGASRPEALAGAAWRVLLAARSGIRLAGPALPSTASATSAPLLPGAVQATPGGEAIVVGPDGGVTGGYPVVGVVATVDLDRLSLLRAGDEVRFRVVGVDEAATARRERQALVQRSLARVHLLG